MSWQWWLLVVALLLAVFVAIYLSSTAGRLDRLHHRVDVSRANLVAELRRRRDLTDHVAAIGVVDPASALLLADAVQQEESCRNSALSGHFIGDGAQTQTCRSQRSIATLH